MTDRGQSENSGIEGIAVARSAFSWKRGNDTWQPQELCRWKTDHGKLITSYQCNSKIADAEFLFAKQQYIKKTGCVMGEDDVIAYHLRQSFVPGEITPEEAIRMGCVAA